MISDNNRSLGLFVRANYKCIGIFTKYNYTEFYFGSIYNIAQKSQVTC